MIIRLPVGPPIVIQTRAGNNITCEPGFQITEEDRQFYERLQQGKFPVGNRLTSVRKRPTGVYNCHGMTFLSRRALLIEDEAVEQILRDDTYYDVDQREVCPGDIILYFDTNGALEHSGVVVHVPKDEGIICPWVLSKWGNGGEYVHRYDYCLYNWRDVRYKREGHHD